MSDVIERLARVIDPFVFGVAHDAPDAPKQRDEARKVARDVLRELREPNKEMIKAALEIPPVCELYRGQMNVLSWQAMIDAALTSANTASPPQSPATRSHS